MSKEIDNMDADELVDSVDVENIQQQVHGLINIPDSGTYKMRCTMKKGHPISDREHQLVYDKILPQGMDSDELHEELLGLDLDIGDTVVVEIDVDDRTYEIIGKGGEL